ncbi:nucleotidyl transferase AbiEii/AbiGii toxin family protein [Demequina sp. NBRC 110052]|uniref:nucleotidyl transferase AbiEii/AbiGii toxin family protein n=1 Tax=Demequina sp. NBRC 110052 TaxID=1570341 RepID=UPI000A01E629|nr:nucleotidyl transferase AbiEii/AbiGii toxin family protein [Demequina sp. NBRC 110052]
MSPNPQRGTPDGDALLAIRSLARATGGDVQELHTLYVLEAFLSRIAASEHHDDFVLKGGVLLAAFALRRPTKDIDLQATGLANDADDVAERVRAIASIDMADGVIFDTASVVSAAIRDEEEYAGVRVRLVGHLGRSRVTIGIDVNFGDPIWPAPTVVEVPRLVALGEFGLLFTLPLLLQNALGYSALGTGWLVLFLAIGTFLISGATPQLTARMGARAVVRIGLALEAIAVGGLALTLSADISGAAIAAWLFVYGAGVGMATAQLTNVILVEVPVAESGQASGLQSTFRQLGSALGVAILGTLLFVSLGKSTDAHLADAGVPADARPAIVETVRHSAGAVIPSLQADQATAVAGDAAAEAMITASRITTGIATGVILVGLAATFALPDATRRREEDDEPAGQGTV